MEDQINLENKFCTDDTQLSEDTMTMIQDKNDFNKLFSTIAMITTSLVSQP